MEPPLAIMDSDKPSPHLLFPTDTTSNSGFGNDLGRREKHRQRALKEAQIVFNSSQSVINCTIRDRSQNGAKLRLASAAALPDNFEVFILSELRLYPSELRWRRGDDLGVEFVGPSRAIRKT